MNRISPARVWATYLTGVLALLLNAAPVWGQQTAASAPQTQPGDALRIDDRRVNALLEKLEQQRDEHYVPGLGIAVVHGDEVVLCAGLGTASLEDAVPATGDTVFAIGSSTKSFTATLIGLLVDEGVMNWDDPVRTHLPEFHLSDGEADEKVTIRDLLAHRTGLGRMSLLWASGRLSRDEILDAVDEAELLSPYGTQFNYSNINYIAAGEASARAAGMSWEQLVRTRLLEPLQMNSSTVTVEAARTKGTLATGYIHDEFSGEFEVDPMRSIDAGAPAGAINSSARDMANWLRLQINDGVFEGKRLISTECLDETRTAQISLAPGVGYGLGWMLGEWNGHTVIEHGGNIDGFAAQVAYIPELDLGYVLLMNCSFTPLQATANSVVFGALLESDAPDADEITVDLAEYVGKYIADFGPFQDDRWTVQTQNSVLTVDVPGQMVFELKPPDDEGKWHFAITDQIAVSFERNDDGDVTMMKLHQGGFDMELPREGVETPVEVEPADVREYLGAYQYELMNDELTVLIRNGRLAVDVPGQMIYELHRPDEQDRWMFRVSGDIWVRFDRADDGTVESMTMSQRGFETVCPRVGDPADYAVVTLDEVMAMHQQAVGGANLDAIDTVRMTGTIRFVNQAVSGTIDIMARGLTHYRNHMDLGRCGTISVIIAGDRGWTVSSFDPTDELEGEYLRAVQRQHPLLIAADWRDVMDEVTLKEVTEEDGREVYIVRARLGEMIKSTITVDAETGLVTAENLVMMAPGIGAMPMRVVYDDYREVAGLMLPFRIESSTLWHGKIIVELTSIETNVTLPDDAFVVPDDA